MHSLSASFGSSQINPTTTSNSFLKYKWQEIKLQPKFQRNLNSFLDRNINPNSHSAKRSLSQYIEDLESTSPSKSLNAFQSQCSLIQGQKYSAKTLEAMIKKNEEILLRQSYEIAGLRDLLQQTLQMYQGDSYNNHNNNNNNYNNYHTNENNYNQNQYQNDNGFSHSSLRVGRTSSMTHCSNTNNNGMHNNTNNQMKNLNNNSDSNNSNNSSNNKNKNNNDSNSNNELLALKQKLEQEQQNSAGLQLQLEESDKNAKKFQFLAQQLQDQLNGQPDTQGLQEEANLWKKKYIDLNRTLNQTQTQLMMAETELESLKTKQQSENQIKLSRQSSIQSPDTIARSNNRRRTTQKLVDPQQQLIQVQQ